MRVNSPYGQFYLMADISEHQGFAGSSKPAPNLQAYKAAGFQHLSQRVFSGWREDYSAGRNLLEAKAAGLSTMWYVWLDTNNPASTALSSLKSVLDRMVGLVGKPPLGIMLDVEDTTNKLSPAAYAFYIRQVEALCAAYGSVSFYTAGWYWSNHLKGQTQWANRPLITASYPFQTTGGVALVPLPNDLSEYGNWAFQRGDRGQGAVPGEWLGAQWGGWQFTSIAKVPGFVGNVDLNLIRPSWFDSLGVLPTPGPVPPVPIPPVVPDPIPALEEPMPKLIAYADDPSTIYLTHDWNETTGSCLFVVPASGAAIGTWRPISGPYPDPDASNPWGVKIVDAEARANHVRVPFTPGAGFYSDVAAGARGPAGPQGPAGPAGANGRDGVSPSPDSVLSALKARLP